MDSNMVPTLSTSPSMQQKKRRFVFRPVSLLAWLIAVLAITFAVLAPILRRLNGDGTIGDVPAEVVLGTLLPLVGALIASRRPKNAIGWLLCVIGLSESLSTFSSEYSVFVLLTHPYVLPFGGVVSWIDSWVWVVGYGLFPLALLLFPTGRLLSPRWRWVAWVSSGAVLLAVLSTAIPSWAIRGVQLLNATNSDQNQTGVVGIYDILLNISFIALTLAVIASAINLIVRFLRARGVERQQLKWFTYAVVLTIIDLIAANIYESFFAQTPLSIVIDKIVQALPAAAVSIAIGIAMFRYRLYDIDVLIKRTLVYGLLTGILVLCYFGGVVGLQFVFRSFIGQESPFAIVASTLLIAILFQPLRRRIQQVIDRRFYRRQYNAALTVQNFSANLRDEVDLEQLRVHLIKVVEETIQPTHVSLWLRNVEKKTRENS